MFRTAALLVVIGGLLAVEPAQAQFGGVFGNSPPRPPADVPNGFPPQPPPVGYPGQNQAAPYPGQAYPSQSYPSQPYPGQPYPEQRANQGQYPNQPPAAPARQPSAVQSQPLAPPPRISAAPPPPLQRARATPAPANPPPPQPADTSPRPDDTVITEMPTQKIANARAVFSGLDKITGRIITFDAAIGETVQFGALQVTARVCYTRPPTEATNTDAFIEVDEVTLQGEIKRIFSGWMFAASPGLHAVEHPIYDVWLTDCKEPMPMKVAEPVQPTPPPAAPPARPPSRSR